MNKNPEADSNCKQCHGYGEVDISGNMCYGFGARPKMAECWCIFYKSIGMNMDGTNKKRRVKK